MLLLGTFAGMARYPLLKAWAVHAFMLCMGRGRYSLRPGLFLEDNRMALIDIRHLTFGYDGSPDLIFEDVSFQIDTAWKLGFTGRNGRGKTTFFKLLQEKEEYQGTIAAPVAFDYFPYEVKDESEQALDVITRVCPEYEFWQLIREMNLLELPEEVLFRPFSTLSGGEKTKLLLAAMFLKENNFLLIDEPTNHLDMKGRQLLSRYLNGKSGFILVSHDRAFLDGCVDHMLAINRANITVQKGNFTAWQQNKEMQDAFERSENERLNKEISRLKETAREKAAWSDHAERTKKGDQPGKDVKVGWMPKQAAKAKKMMSRAKAIETRQQNAIEEKESMLKNIDRKEDLKIAQLPYHTDLFLALRDVCVYYDGVKACGPITLEVRRGERIALNGRNGCGKTSLIRLIRGEEIAYTGEMEMNPRLRISCVSQDASDLRGGLSEYAQRCEVDETQFKTILRKLDFSREQFEKPLESYSAGQKKKVLLARSLCEKAHLHIWDEPMNYIDVISRIQLEELLLKFQPTLLFVEHDRAFQEKVATRVLEM